jgi:hypothetical protein
MLKLHLFAPCEKVIISQDNITSVIAVMESFNVKVSEELPPDAGVPFQWNVVTIWHRTEDVAGDMTYEQRTEVLRPDGEHSVNATHPFPVSNAHINFRNVVEINGFPVGQEGFVVIKVSLREAGDQNEWRAIADYRIRVKHRAVEADNEETGNETAELG